MHVRALNQSSVRVKSELIISLFRDEDSAHVVFYLLEKAARYNR